LRRFGLFRIVRPGIVRLAPPNLAAEPEVVVNDPTAGTPLRRASGGRHACGASADHEDFEVLARFPSHLFQFSLFLFSLFQFSSFQISNCQFSVVTCIPCSHST
jgi:hypothetical protein